MKNTLTCRNCGSENPFYGSICTNCNFYLRDKIVNIDLWNIIGKLIETPVTAFKTIVRSEHKNFIVPIILFTAIKFFIDAIFILVLQKKEENLFNSFLPNFLIILIVLIIILSLYSVLIKILTSKTLAKTRFKDNFAVLVYSLIPHTLALCIIFPIEVVVFGGYVFSSNPSPFSIKPVIAYLLGGFEILIALWTIFLSIAGLYCQTRSKLFAFSFGIVLNVVNFLFIFLIGKLF